MGRGPDQVNINVFAPVTGELIQQIVDAPNPNDTRPMGMGISKDSFITSQTGATTVSIIGWQTIYVIVVQDGAPVIRSINPPSEGQSTADVAISPDGTTLSMANENDESRTRWLLDLTDPAAEWLKVPSDGACSGPGTIQFLPGVD